jgi:hypothetical protein
MGRKWVGLAGKQQIPGRTFAVKSRFYYEIDLQLQEVI